MLKDQVFAFVSSCNGNETTTRGVFRKFHDVRCPEILDALQTLVAEKKIEKVLPNPDWDVSSEKYRII